MAEMLKLGLVLMLVALVAAVALGLVNSRTAPMIAEQKEMEKQALMSDVAAALTPADSLEFDSLGIEGLENPFAGTGNELSVVAVRPAGSDSVAGFVFVAYGKGYSSTVQTMVAVSPDGEVESSSILYQMETPGLGANVEDPAKLLDQLSEDGVTAESCRLTVDGGTIDAMTGSTITSRAVVASVQEGLEAMEEEGLFDGSGLQGWSPDPPPNPPPKRSSAGAGAEPGEGIDTTGTGGGS